MIIKTALFLFVVIVALAASLIDNVLSKEEFELMKSMAVVFPELNALICDEMTFNEYLEFIERYTVLQQAQKNYLNILVKHNNLKGVKNAEVIVCFNRGEKETGTQNQRT